MRPIVTPEMGTIRYVDHETTEGLKAKYAHDPNVDINQIVDVDYVWGTQKLPELVGDATLFDYVIASHVIEHVPDLIGWLKEIQTVLKPGGILSLVIPDKRYCFDYYRQLTKPADVLEAYLRSSRKPSPRQIFDHFASCVYWRGMCAWSGEVEKSELFPYHSEAQAWEAAQSAFIQDHYCDVHCWVFTPYSFFQLFKTLVNLNLLDFKIARFHPTEGCEFFVSLQALENIDDQIADRNVQLESLSVVIAELFTEQPNLNQFDWESKKVQESAKSQQTCSLTTRSELEELKIQLEQTNEQLQSVQTQSNHLRERLQYNRDGRKRLKSRLKSLRKQLNLYQNEVVSMRASKFWKLRTQWIKLKEIFGIGK